MSSLILVVDDESDVEILFRQQFRRDLRAGFAMDFDRSADSALQHINDTASASLVLILSHINMPGMSGLELLPKAKTARPDVPVIMITAYGDDVTKRKALEGGAEALLTNARGDLRRASSPVRSQQRGNRHDRCWHVSDVPILPTNFGYQG